MKDKTILSTKTLLIFSLWLTVVLTATMKFPILLLVALCFTCESFAKKGFGPGEQEWGYETVRANANMFWWLYYTSAKVSSYYERPLIIWLQGGPGASSTSYGNFEELGPLDAKLNERNHTWVKNYNVLFIDNPVGTGFSYTTSTSAFATTNAQIAQDLLACIKGFLKKLPQFENVPTYITTESYGGKMGAEFALVWYKAQNEGKIKSNFKGVALGDAWISPIDSVMTWAPFLQATGMIDSNGYKLVDSAARKTKAAVESGSWRTATTLWSYAENVVSRATNNIDFYNILTKVSPSYKQYSLTSKLLSDSPFLREKAVYVPASLDALMNGPVKKALGVSMLHGSQSNTVFSRLQEDFMKPVVDKVEMLLNQTNLKVVVLTGHLDLIVDTPGTLQWVEKLKWKNATAWQNSNRVPVVANGIVEGYVKSHGNFAVYWINRAGHMVPKDNPNGMEQLLKAFAN